MLSTQEEYCFIQQNDYWVIRYQADVALLKSMRGMCCLALLLRDPGREFHVSELLAPSLEASNPGVGVAARGPAIGGLFAGFPFLDAQARTKYKRRLNELRRDLEEAERFKDSQRKAQAEEEMTAAADYLADAVGLGSRDRRTSSDAERARSAVTKCIRKAVKKIGDAIPTLGYHFATRIKTGYFCCYDPHPARIVNWKVLTGTHS